MDYIEYLKNECAEVEKILRERIAEIPEFVPSQIVEAMEYSLLAGGKRIRPIMLRAAAKASGLKDISQTDMFASAIEMIHTSSLIHDDLPAMDNDDLRRGRPTNHKVYGEAMAILAGDALLNHASEIMARYVAEHNEKRFAMAGYTVNRVTGITGMIGGQTIDILAEKTGLDIASEEILTKIHSMKTCALLEGAVVAGAYIGGADDATIEKWKKYALYLGLAFQIIDDILDVTGDEATLGKPVGSDSENGKPTFVTLMGVDGAKAIAKKYTDMAVETAKSIGNAEFFVWLAEYLCKREY